MKKTYLGFIGFGLIGGSIAKSIKKKSEEYYVKVYSRRKNPNLDQGVKDGVIDEIVYEIEDNFADCDVIFLCAPVIKNTEFFEILKGHIKPECIITDVGSVKGNICKAASDAGLGVQFIGGHPMAGSEKTGYENATDILLENAYYLLTPSEENKAEDVEKLKNIVKLTGANCVVLSSSTHDKITAAISHVPHIIAVSLVNLVKNNDDEESNMKAFAAGGFKDITRIASSSPAMWQDICQANKDYIELFLKEYEEMIKNFREKIHNDENDYVYSNFDEAGEYRNSIPNTKSSLISRSYDVYVNIDDRAGAIATIATILSIKNISIKNIGIINNREFADGVLRIELYNEDDMIKTKELLLEKNYEIATRGN